MTMSQAAIMFADVSGSSKLFKEVGDEKARGIVSKVVDMMMRYTQTHKGVVIKTIGDEVMARFDTAIDAMQAATAIQKDISSRYYGAPLAIRIGFHFGQVIKEAGDVYGEAVNDAADLVKVAKGGQVVTSEQTRLALPDVERAKLKWFDDIRLKGGKETAPIYIVEWEDREESTATMFFGGNAHQADAEIPAATVINLVYEGVRHSLSADQMPFSIGRSADANLTVHFSLASRDHCTIDFRRGKFVLIDKSTNGTYVAPDGGQKLYLRREEAPLSGAGVIGFSADVDVPGSHIMRYQC